MGGGEVKLWDKLSVKYLKAGTSVGHFQRLFTGIFNIFSHTV